MPPAKNKHGGKREGAGGKKGSKNQMKGQLSVKTKLGAILRCLDDTGKKGPEAITVEAAREKRAAAEQLAIEQQERDRQKREDQRKEEQKKEQERLLIMQEERKKNEKAAAEALAAFQDHVEASIGNNNAPGGGGGGDGDGGDGGDDDDDDDYEGHDDIADLNPDEAHDRDEDNGAPSSRASWKHKPPLDSDLGQHLERKKTNVANEIQLSLHATAGTCWFPPTKSATEDIEVKTSSFCEEQAWTHSFYPFGSRSLATKKVKDYKCFCCGEVGGLEFNAWHCRPQTWFDKTVWLLHGRVRCRKKECGKSWAAFHPEFMKQPPNALVERFPFLTTVSGIGVHSAVLTQFLFLATKGVLFGACAESINEMKKTKCWRDVLSHQDLSSDKLDGLRDWVHSFVPTVFPPCNSVGKYNGMPLRKSLVRKLFIQFMDSRELHMQHSFQPQHDESEASDHSFKCAKQTMAGNRAGNAFTAACDSVGLAGCCTFNRFCHAKSNDEMKPLIKKVKEVRINAGVAALKRCEGDGGGDRSVWPAEFPELLTNTKPPRKKSKNGNPVPALKEDQCMCFTSLQQVNNWALSLAPKVEALKAEVIHCGIDTEWNMDNTSHITRVMQMCFPNTVYDKIVVLDLTEMGWFEDIKCPEGLKTLLLNENLTPVAVQASQDLPRVRKLGIDLKNSVELMTLGGQVHPGIHRGHNMKKMAQRVLGLEADKTHQRGTDWTLIKDRKDFQEYAALDAHIHLLPCHKLVEPVEQAKKDGTTPNRNVEIGKKVQLTCRNKTAAVGELQFIGGDEGERRKWGSMTVGKGNGLVKITEVRLDSERPPYSFDVVPDSGCFKRSWKKKDVTLKELFDCDCREEDLVIAWPTDRMTLMLESVEPFVVLRKTQPSEDQQQPTDEGEAELDHPAAVAMEVEVDLTGPDDITLHYADDTTVASVGDPNVPATRMHMDGFHAFDSMPASRDPKIKPLLSLIRRLIMQGTIEFDADDWGAMTTFLREHHNITDLEDVLDHFNFQREWWCQRVRVHPPTAEKGAQNMEEIKKCASENPMLKEAWSNDLEEHFDGLTDMFSEGKPSECFDVEMYQFDGKDKHGLSKWLRKRGSNRSENPHQKMRVAFGPHGVGAEVGHYLLLLVSYRYNINAGIRRKGLVNFGMPHCDTIDRMQLRMMKLHGHDPFPSHPNQTLFKPVEDYAAVGVGPLNYEDKHATKSDVPSDVLSGDLKFLAARMKLVGPPLHVAHPKEKKTFNDCMGSLNVNPGDKQWDDLASPFLQKADYMSTFPKLPSMLKKHYNKWKGTQELASVKNQLQVNHCGLLKRLGDPKADNDTINAAADFQKTSSDDNRMQQQSGENNDNGAAFPIPDDIPDDPPPVPPAAAHTQTECVVARVDNRSVGGKRCSGAPFGCPNFANDCSGMNLNHKHCKPAINKSKLVKAPENEAEIKALQSAYRKEQDELSKRRKRAAAAALLEAAAEENNSNNNNNNE